MADPSEIAGVLAQLGASPARFAAALSNLEAADSVETAIPGEWSPAEVLAHVRASQDIMEHRIYAVLVRDNPPLPAFDNYRWMEVAHYAGLPVTESLDGMRVRRKELVRALRSVSPGDWDRTGTHEVRGPLSVLAIARSLVEHEAEHYEQIARSGTAYADENVTRR